jgi:plasmid stabilization system protein ParE
MAVARPRLLFHPAIIDDLEAIVTYYAELDESLPSRFRARFREQVSRLRRLPRSGAVLFEDVRRVVIKRFPYLVVYRIQDEQVLVLAVISFRRDPDWIRRIASSRSTDISTNGTG